MMRLARSHVKRGEDFSTRNRWRSEKTGRAALEDLSQLACHADVTSFNRISRLFHLSRLSIPPLCRPPFFAFFDNTMAESGMPEQLNSSSQNVISKLKARKLRSRGIDEANEQPFE
jgi:hypothetical protein